MMFPQEEGKPLPEPQLNTSPLEPKLLEIPAAVQRTNEQALRAAYEASGGAELGDSTNPPVKAPSVEVQTLEIIPASVATRAMTMMFMMALIFEDYW